MFSQSLQVLQPDRQQLEAGDVTQFAKFFELLSGKPRAALAQRSAFLLSFEDAGVSGNWTRDARARRFVASLEAAVPFVGYFLNGNAPFFHLRKISLALSYASPDGPTVDTCVQAHHRLYQAAAAHCPVVGDTDLDRVEEVFVVNLPHEVLHQNPVLQARAMRELHEVLLLALTSSPQLSSLAFTEAERTWGRSVAEFDSPEAFVGEFERTYRQRLAPT